MQMSSIIAQVLAYRAYDQDKCYEKAIQLGVKRRLSNEKMQSNMVAWEQ